MGCRGSSRIDREVWAGLPGGYPPDPHRGKECMGPALALDYSANAFRAVTALTLLSVGLTYSHFRVI